MSSTPSRRRAHAWSTALAGLLALSPGTPSPANATPDVYVVQLAAKAPGGSQPSRYRLEADPGTLRADARGMWALRLRFVNGSEAGAYPDSLHVEWVSEDGGGAPRSGRSDLSGIARAMGAVSAGDSTEMNLNVPAECTRGELRFRLWVHGAKQVSNVVATVAVTGSDLDERTPSLELDAGGRKAELVIVRPDSAVWPAPTLLVLPPAGVRARSLVRWSLAMTERGLAVALLGPPGTGASQGPDDRSGPASLAAVESALARLAREPACDARRRLLWGEAQGATTALLASASHAELAGVVALNAAMDPWAAYRAMGAPEQAAYVAAVGRDSAAWKARSPLEAAARIPAAVLVLHTDLGGPNAASLQFVQARSTAGLPVESRVSGQEPRPLRRPDATRLSTEFILRRSRGGSP
jgi:hypothetical protein